MQTFHISYFPAFCRQDVSLNEHKMGQSIQEWTKENLWKTAFQKFEVIWPAEAHYLVHS